MTWQVKRLRDELAGPGLTLLRARNYRLKAEECRTVADELRDEHARRAMLDVAMYYERLAEHHERSLPTLVDAPNPFQRAVSTA